MARIKVNRRIVRPEPQFDGLSATDILEMVIVKTEQADTLRRWLRRPIDFRLDPLVVKQDWILGPRWVPGLMALGFVMGAGMVYKRKEAQRLHVIARESTFEMWDLYSRPFMLANKDQEDPAFRGRLLQAVHNASTRQHLPRTIWQARDEREALLYVQHKVAELWPELRYIDGPGEVALHPHHGGLRVGGIALPYEHYYSGAYEKGLLKTILR